ncbi:MAG: hypothetical protein AB7U20_11365 [Planctomycetaceae bacterium]
MNRHTNQSAPTTAPRRAGTAMIVAIICLTLTSAMAVSLVRLALASHEQADREGWRLQSVWLAESGLRRAAARLEGGDEYAGEMWAVDDLGAAHEGGRVAITITEDAENGARLTITAIADFPLDPDDRIRTTRTLTFPRDTQITASSPTKE